MEAYRTQILGKLLGSPGAQCPIEMKQVTKKILHYLKGTSSSKRTRILSI